MLRAALGVHGAKQEGAHGGRRRVWATGAEERLLQAIRQ